MELNSHFQSPQAVTSPLINMFYRNITSNFGTFSTNTDSLELSCWNEDNDSARVQTTPAPLASLASPYSTPRSGAASRVSRLREQLGREHTLRANTNLSLHRSDSKSSSVLGMDAPSAAWSPFDSMPTHGSAPKPVKSLPSTSEQTGWFQSITTPFTSCWNRGSEPPCASTAIPLELQPQTPIQDSNDTVIDFRDVPLNTSAPKAPKSKQSRKGLKYACAALVVLIILMVRNPKCCRGDNFTHAS